MHERQLTAKATSALPVRSSCYQGTGAGAALNQQPPETCSKHECHYYCLITHSCIGPLHTATLLSSIAGIVAPCAVPSSPSKFPSTQAPLEDVRGQIEPWSPEALAPSFWFETIDFPHVFLWSLSSASRPHASARNQLTAGDGRGMHECYTYAHSKQAEEEEEAICATSLLTGEMPSNIEVRLLDLFVIENLYRGRIETLSLGLAGEHGFFCPRCEEDARIWDGESNGPNITSNHGLVFESIIYARASGSRRQKPYADSIFLNNPHARLDVDSKSLIAQATGLSLTWQLYTSINISQYQK